MADVRTYDVTALLISGRRGTAGQWRSSCRSFHGELRRIAKPQMAGERADHVLQATALVNEVYLKLIDIHQIQWQDRTHFFAMAARLMRRVLVDFARAQHNQKRGGGLHRVTFDQNLPVTGNTPEDVMAIDEALRGLQVRGFGGSGARGFAGSRFRGSLVRASADRGS